jgi:hypothetical protein
MTRARQSAPGTRLFPQGEQSLFLSRFNRFPATTGALSTAPKAARLTRLINLDAFSAVGASPLGWLELSARDCLTLSVGSDAVPDRGARP